MSPGGDQRFTLAAHGPEGALHSHVADGGADELERERPIPSERAGEYLRVFDVVSLGQRRN